MNKKELGIVILGTPEFALPSLEMLLKEGYCVKAVITQPDRQKGRGHKLLPPPVKVLAEENEIPVYQFNKISSEGKELLQELAPDLMITVAFGQILSREVLNIPKYGCINVHASLLPKYRGAAPIEMAVVNGEKKTGISTMYTVYELDAGDVLEQDETGSWYFNDRFLFSCDSSVQKNSDRETLWNQARENLTSGAYGDPSALSTLILFWSKMEELDYPGAGDTRAYLMEQSAEREAPSASLEDEEEVTII